MDHVQTPFKQAAVVSALIALPALKQLTWQWVKCNGKHGLVDGRLLQLLKSLTSLELEYVRPKGLNCIGSLSQRQHLSVSYAGEWVAAGCPGLQQLKALTSLELLHYRFDLRVKDEFLTSVCQLTALQQLHVHRVTCTGLKRLHVLTGLTQLRVMVLGGVLLEGLPLQLPGLQHLELSDWDLLPSSALASCTRLQVLKLKVGCIMSAGNLVASTMLQHLQLEYCSLWCEAGNGAQGPGSWQQVFPGTGRQLPHLTSLHILSAKPKFQPADIERVVSCCNSLQALHLDALSCNSALTRLSGLTSLSMEYSKIKQCCRGCSAVAQLTGLRELTAHNPLEVSAGGLRQLTALQQLTSLALVYNNTSRHWPRPVLLEQLSDRLPHSLTSQWPHCFSYHAFINKAPAGHPSDVSARLLRVCDMAAGGDG